MQSIIDTILSDPTYQAVLLLALVLAGIVSRRVLGPEDDWVERYKRRLAVALDPWSRRLGTPLAVKKGPEEYVCSTDLEPDEVERRLHRAGYVENDLSNQKYRVLPDGTTEYAVGSMKYSEPRSSRQWHVYLFDGHGDYGADLYQHGETDWDPAEGGGPGGHLSGEQVPGDPEGLLRNALSTKSVECEEDIRWRQQHR